MPAASRCIVMSLRAISASSLAWLKTLMAPGRDASHALPMSLPATSSSSSL
eukprot:CAMPEP_0173462320 /NCGR_PEP_ID=MMETSP1357-20121228/66449_1 /TAXON_ID=77926 /ORGANISM="Hemiselmis rufescens, Strain PCC563" /LENGTH=50 /DNA_ID=CAMNT_0014430043 /DNA_START=260 /DNA_END=412 /DNA_ORIENTATION=+